MKKKSVAPRLRTRVRLREKPCPEQGGRLRGGAYMKAGLERHRGRG